MIKKQTSGMKYEKTPVRRTNPDKLILDDMRRLRTSTILLFLVKRHRQGLTASWAVVATVAALAAALS